MKIKPISGFSVVVGLFCLWIVFIIVEVNWPGLMPWFKAWEGGR